MHDDDGVQHGAFRECRLVRLSERFFEVFDGFGCMSKIGVMSLAMVETASGSYGEVRAS